MYCNVSEVPGILLLFVSTFCDILVFYNLMYNTGHYVQPMPKSVIIQKCVSYLHQEICVQKPNLYAILWEIVTFMKFCGDFYDIYENNRIFINNASWEILNRTFFNRISKYNGGYQVTMVTEKRILRIKRTFFIDNVKNMFVLSILQTVSGTSTPIKSYCTF